jgi:hypothetical protein
VRNYIELARRWFGRDLSRYSLYLMPIGLLSVPVVEGVLASGPEEQLVRYLQDLATATETADDDFHVLVSVDISMRRVAGSETGVAVTTNLDAPEVRLTEEDIRRQCPWDYRELAQRLRGRYVDFKENARFHEIRRSLEGNSSLVRTRYLDPGNPRSGQKRFFNGNVLAQFDAHYVRRAEPMLPSADD